jgi:short-subunit dehydrogenase
MEMLNVNCRALLGLTWHFSQRFAQQRRGGIVLMSSIVGFQGMPFAAHYAATKAYMQTLAEARSVELAPTRWCHYLREIVYWASKSGAFCRVLRNLMTRP